MANLKVNSGIDIDTSINAQIPTGAIVTIGGAVSQLATTYSNIDTTGLCPCDGRTLSRTTYANLWDTFGTTFTTAGITSGSPSISGLSGMSAATHVGWGIAGTGIPTGATILSVTNSTTVTISSNATSTAPGTGNIAISPYTFTGAGNTTTFNVPLLFSSANLGERNHIRGAGTGSILGIKSVTGNHSHDSALYSAYATLQSSSYDHTHTGSMSQDAADAPNHSHGSPGGNTNSGWADVGALGKSDGAATAAGNGHSHNAAYFEAGTTSGGGASHTHTAMTANAPTNTNSTAHTHTLAAPIYLGVEEVIPPSISALYFIKL